MIYHPKSVGDGQPGTPSSVQLETLRGGVNQPWRSVTVKLDLSKHSSHMSVFCTERTRHDQLTTSAFFARARLAAALPVVRVPDGAKLRTACLVDDLDAAAFLAGAFLAAG